MRGEILGGLAALYDMEAGTGWSHVRRSESRKCTIELVDISQSRHEEVEKPGKVPRV